MKQAEQPCDRDLVDLGLLCNIHEIWEDSGFTYGADRIHRQLRRDGIGVGRKRVERLTAGQVLRWAVEAMGWDGVLLSQVTILGTLVSVVALLDREAHINRQETTPAPPNPDLDTLAMWEWPQGHGTFPPTAVSIVGVVAHEGRSLRERVVAARKWRGIARGDRCGARERSWTPEAEIRRDHQAAVVAICQLCCS